MDRIAGDGETGTGNIFLTQVGQRLLEFSAPFMILARYFLRRLPGLPDTQEPDPVEAHLGQSIYFGIGNIVQHCRPTQILT